MHDPHYPTVDKDFLINQVNLSGKINPPTGGMIEIGSTIAFTKEGHSASYRRTTVIRVMDENQVCFEAATTLAQSFNFLRELIHWFEKNRGWKDGAYSEPALAALAPQSKQA